MYIVANELDAFDFNNSTYETDPDLDEICRIEKYAFKKGFRTDLDIFRLKGDGAAIRTSVIVSDWFRQIYDDNDLKGMAFLPIMHVKSLW